jgi:hypothetical protein
VALEVASAEKWITAIQFSAVNPIYREGSAILLRRETDSARFLETQREKRMEISPRNCSYIDPAMKAYGDVSGLTLLANPA